jgi:hypothetical protein
VECGERGLSPPSINPLCYKKLKNLYHKYTDKIVKNQVFSFKSFVYLCNHSKHNQQMTEIEIIRTAPPKKPVIHKVGNFYRNSNDHGLYQLTGGMNTNEIFLIEIESGILWESLQVKDIKNITDEEFDLLIGHDPTLFDYVERVQINYVL